MCAFLVKTEVWSSAHGKDSADFVEQIWQASLEETDVRAIFDVTSLFTRVPVNEALVVISQRLQNDATLKERTNVDIPDLSNRPCMVSSLCCSVFHPINTTGYSKAYGTCKLHLTSCG